MYFYEDEVYAIDKKNNVKFGLVLEIDEFELRENLVRVVWHSNGIDEIINTDKVSISFPFNDSYPLTFHGQHSSRSPLQELCNKCLHFPFSSS